MPPAAGGAEGVRRGGLLCQHGRWPYLENGWNFIPLGLVGEASARVFHRRDLLHFAFDPAVFQAGGEQIAGFDLFCLLQHRTVAHRGDAVARASVAKGLTASRWVTALPNRSRRSLRRPRIISASRYSSCWIRDCARWIRGCGL